MTNYNTNCGIIGRNEMKNLDWSIQYLERFVRVSEYGACLDVTFKEALADLIDASSKYQKLKDALKEE